jgi:hypothetical protein
MATKVLRFDSVNAMMAHCTAGQAEHPSPFLGRGSFTGRSFKTWSDLEAAVKDAWQEGLDAVQAMIFEIDREKHKLPTPVDIRRRKRFADQGDDIDLDRLRSGQDAWIDCPRRQTQAPKAVTLFVNVAACGNVEPMEVLWRGAAAICLADLLEKNGYRVELWLCRYVDLMGGPTTMVQVKLKDMASQVDISSLTNAVSAWFYRTAGFQATDNDTGRPLVIKSSQEPIKEVAGNTLTIVVDDVFTQAKALKLIRDTLAKLVG